MCVCVCANVKMREGRNRLLRGGKDRGGERLMKVIEKEKVGKRKEKKWVWNDKRDRGIVEESLWICRIPSAWSFGTKSHWHTYCLASSHSFFLSFFLSLVLSLALVMRTVGVRRLSHTHRRVFNSKRVCSHTDTHTLLLDVCHSARTPTVWCGNRRKPRGSFLC